MVESAPLPENIYAVSSHWKRDYFFSGIDVISCQCFLSYAWVSIPN